jgi:hypothetical protein
MLVENISRSMSDWSWARTSITLVMTNETLQSYVSAYMGVM